MSVGYDKHIFVCMNERRAGHPRGCCLERGSGEVRARLKALIARHGLKGRVRANKAGCLDYCEHGPTVVVYPDGVWYGRVTVEDADRIFEEHVLHDRVVEDCLLRPDEEES
ncbi:MAG: (2Fe-2S) ferredoxin domain-containing protein [Myxococcota bacterium]